MLAMMKKHPITRREASTTAELPRNCLTASPPPSGRRRIDRSPRRDPTVPPVVVENHVRISEDFHKIDQHAPQMALGVIAVDDHQRVPGKRCEVPEGGIGILPRGVFGARDVSLEIIFLGPG